MSNGVLNVDSLVARQTSSRGVMWSRSQIGGGSLLTLAERTEKKAKEDFGGALGTSAGVGSNAGCVANAYCWRSRSILAAVLSCPFRPMTDACRQPSRSILVTRRFYQVLKVQVLSMQVVWDLVADCFRYKMSGFNNTLSSKTS